MRSQNFNIFQTSDGINLSYYFTHAEKASTILFLHGFTGCINDWIDIIPSFENEFNILAIDLIGHGKSDAPKDVSFYSEDNIVKHIFEIINYLNLNELIIVGYSMGGRAALSFFFSYPKNVKALILESASPGIEEETERKNRLLNDFNLANRIEEIGTKKFIDEWMEAPLFQPLKKLPESDYKNIKGHRYSNDKTGLANSLRGFSQGIMKSYWERLSEIKIPVLLLSGELDDKYRALNKRVNSTIPDSEFRTVKSAGHNIHLQNRDEFINLAKQFLNNHF